MSGQQLISVDAFSRELAQANSVPELKALVDKSEAVIQYMRKAGLYDIDTVRGLAVERCKAVVKAGRALEQMAPDRTGRAGRINVTGDVYFRTLDDAGLKRRSAERWRSAGKIEDDRLENWFAKIPSDELPKLSKLYTLGRIAKATTENGPHRTDTVADLAALAGSGQQFGVIYADPPWSFRVYSGKGKSRSAENHYDTMTQADIEALGEHIQKLSTKDCTLFIWCVMPQIPEALRVIEAWGFTYKTAGFTWVKRNKSSTGFHIGMGYWTRANPEICLLATRGSPRRKRMDIEQLVIEQVGAHSSKPETVAERITRLVPGPYLELFGRRDRAEWTVWGNDIKQDLLSNKGKEDERRDNLSEVS